MSIKCWMYGNSLHHNQHTSVPFLRPTPLFTCLVFDLAVSHPPLHHLIISSSWLAHHVETKHLYNDAFVNNHICIALITNYTRLCNICVKDNPFVVVVVGGGVDERKQAHRAQTVRYFLSAPHVQCACMQMFQLCEIRLPFPDCQSHSVSFIFTHYRWFLFEQFNFDSVSLCTRQKSNFGVEMSFDRSHQDDASSLKILNCCLHLEMANNNYWRCKSIA